MMCHIACNPSVTMAVFSRGGRKRIAWGSIPTCGTVIVELGRLSCQPLTHLPSARGRTPKLLESRQPLDVVRAAPHAPPAVTTGREPAPGPRGRLGAVFGLALP